MKIAEQTKSIHLLIPVLIAIVLAVFSRLVPHIPNATPIAAMAIFTGAMFSRKSLALLLTLGVLFLSDLFLNNVVYTEFYPTFTWFSEGVVWIYASYIIMILASSKLIKSLNVLPIALTAVTGAVLFFLLSNFGVMMSGVMYSKDLAGLMASYTAALPFFVNTLVADLFFCGVLFGSYAFMVKKQLIPVKVKA